MRHVDDSQKGWPATHIEALAEMRAALSSGSHRASR